MPNRYWQLDRFFSKQDVGAEEWLRDTGFILSSIDTVEDPYFCRIHLETNCKDVACQPALDPTGKPLLTRIYYEEVCQYVECDKLCHKPFSRLLGFMWHHFARCSWAEPFGPCGSKHCSRCNR